MSKNNSKLPSSQKNKSQPTVVTQMQAGLYMGPLPPPQDLEHYNDVVHGAAERIIAMAENQQKERFKLQHSDMALAKVGLFSAWSVTMVGLLIGAFLIYNNKDLGGLIALLGGLAPVIASFVLDRFSQQDKN